jgi:phospholipid/cholesterol/gamma-HCH transport system substrate-binding protein
MPKKHKIRIGLFVIATAALAMGALVLFGGVRFWSPKEHYIIRFDESVLGLETGAQVYVNGIRSGSVDAIDLDPTDLRKVIVEISVKQGTPVHTDSKAMLQLAGITGVKLIDLSGGTSAAPVLPVGGEIPVGKSTLDKLEAEAEDIVTKAGALAAQATEMMKHATKVVDNVIEITDPKRFVDMQTELQTGFKGILVQAKHTTDHLSATSETLHAMVAENRQAVKDSLATVNAAARSASQLMDGPMAGILANANDFVSNLNGLVHDNEGQVRSAVFDLRQASRSFKELARDVRERPSRLLFSSAPDERKLP